MTPHEVLIYIEAVVDEDRKRICKEAWAIGYATLAAQSSKRTSPYPGRWQELFPDERDEEVLTGNQLAEKFKKMFPDMKIKV